MKTRRKPEQIAASLEWLRNRSAADGRPRIKLVVDAADAESLRRRVAHAGWERARRAPGRYVDPPLVGRPVAHARSPIETREEDLGVLEASSLPEDLIFDREAFGPIILRREPPTDDRDDADRCVPLRLRAREAARVWVDTARQRLPRVPERPRMPRLSIPRPLTELRLPTLPTLTLPTLPTLPQLRIPSLRLPALPPPSVPRLPKLRMPLLRLPRPAPPPRVVEAEPRPGLRERLRQALPALLARTLPRFCALLLFAVCMTNLFFLRFENFGYFWYRPLLNAYSIGVGTFILSRFLLALFYRPPRDRGIEPTVSIIITAFNEEDAIYRSIESCYAVDYPSDKLEVVAVDDGSTDGTDLELARARERWPQLAVESFAANKGKREAMAAGARLARAEILLYVDSDSFLRRDAVRQIVQGFANPSVAAVSGHTEVANATVNMLTRMQEVRYYVAFRVLKAAESVFGAVTCCPGCFSAYRRSCVLAVLDRWLDQRFLGVQATFGDDRSLTNLLLRRYRVIYSSAAIASTIVPESHAKFLRQQLRWKKSWLRECLIAASFMWKKHPLAALGFYAQLVFPLLAPIVLLRAFVWIPWAYGDFLSVVLYSYGVMLIGLIFSSYYLFWKIDPSWVYGVHFTLYYMFVLVWQMPYAIATSRDNRWGTR